MLNTLLIVSGAYVDASISAEMGSIPPCFVPVGNNRLFEKQIMEFSNSYENVFLSLPDNFDIDDLDATRLSELNVQLLQTNPEAKLGEAILHCLNIISDQCISILYGDTLITGITHFNTDTVYAHSANMSYNYLKINDLFPKLDNHKESLVVSGFFSFSDSSKLVEKIEKADGDFLSAIQLYNDDIPLSIQSEGTWLDFGNLQTYFRSISISTTSRYFNDIHIDQNFVTKRSKDVSKINAEFNWLKRIPDELKIYTPLSQSFIVQNNVASYTTENLYLSTLKDLLVYGDLSTATWELIFNKIENFLEQTSNFNCLEDSIACPSALFEQKTASRLECFTNTEFGLQICQIRKVNGENVPKFLDIILLSNSILKSHQFSSPVIMHGDLCFSNMFFDFRRQKIKLIDPRGLIDNIQTIYGYQEYDLAKLMHSAIMGYDFILSGHKKYLIDSNTLTSQISPSVYRKLSQLEPLCLNMLQSFNLPIHALYAMQIQLFASMLPLHSDNTSRQLGMVATIYEAYLFLSELK